MLKYYTNRTLFVFLKKTDYICIINLKTEYTMNVKSGVYSVFFI